MIGEVPTTGEAKPSTATMTILIDKQKIYYLGFISTDTV